MRTSIKYKAVLFLALLLILTLGISSYLVLRGIATNQQQRYESQLAQQTQLANLYIRQDYAKTTDTAIDAFMRGKGYELTRQIGQLTATHVKLYDMRGQEIGNSSPGLNSVDVKEVLEYALRGKISYQISGQSLYYLAPVIISNNQVGVIQLYYAMEEDHQFYRTIENLFISIGSIIFIMSFILGYLYFGRMANIIRSLKLAVDNVKLGNYREIPVVKQKDELGALRQGIYFMSSQIEENIKGMKEEQQKLTLAVEKLRALEQQQRQFIGNVTHEFKTPLTVIKAYIDLMDMYPDDEKLVQDAKENIGKETQRLHDMVEKTLHLAALEKYEFELDMQSLQLDEILLEICDRMEGKIQKQGLQLYRELEPIKIYGDRESIFQIFVNLVDNAIKYNNPKGKIVIKSFMKDNDANIEIQDTGIGIPMELKDKIFEPFYTVDRNRSRQSGGTGLGLALVKQMVEKQHGSISIIDRKEQGTSFLIKFPLQQ
ncbi:MAG: histidine kinase [Clostridia bacterium]|jgi:signal transduction histidine kinase|nr:histidine kinase [Clostridia bacterium]